VGSRTPADGRAKEDQRRLRGVTAPQPVRQRCDLSARWEVSRGARRVSGGYYTVEATAHASSEIENLVTIISTPAKIGDII